MRRMFTFLLLFGSVIYANVPAFSLLSPTYSFDQGKPEEAQNMPRIASQDGLGICYACVAATMKQIEKCRQSQMNCNSLSEEEMFAPLDLARMQYGADKSASSVRSGYTGINIEGGSPIDSIRLGALVVKKTANQKCLSLDRILAKMNSRADAEDAKKALWNGLEMAFNQAKAEAAKQEGCKDCLSDIYMTAAEKVSPLIQRDMDIKKDNIQVAQAFAAATYKEFLNQLLGVQKCIRPSETVEFDYHDKVDYESFPKKDGERIRSIEAKEKIREILKSGRPLALNGICYADVKPENCPNGKSHAVVIAGYRKICMAGQGNNCRESFRVLNSWGKSWQDNNDNGWIDADIVLKNTDLGPGALSWFKDR